ncbi:MAG: NADH-quinone oxidoreductase subunit NuoF [Coxiellaceae bacterium]|nr:NADH-quinone oxidoreductase subunit NuoF [Coxiellaceae bacterium]
MATKLDLVCYRTRHLKNAWSMSTYESIGGWSVWRKILKEKTPPEEIIETLKQSDLRGRGGAGFPTGLKWSFLSRDVPGQKYIICNSDESEPGTAKDRDIMRFNPHQLLEGIAIACYVVGASVGYNFLRGEFFEPFQRCEAALEEARAAGLLGKDVMGSGLDIEIFNHCTAGAYICGEETALMNSLEGKRGMPRLKPPFPANFGLYGKPTNVNNCETLATVPVILEKGAKWFSDLGRPKNGGTKIFTVSGHVNKPGNYEIQLGTPFTELLELAGGMKDGKKLKGVIPGGSSMPILPADIIMKTDLDYDSIMKAGSMLGSGGMMVMDESTCMVKVARRFAQFYMHESCGQCTPCREGSGWVFKLLRSIELGKAKLSDIDRLAQTAKNIEGKTICVFGEAISWPVGGFLRHFRKEFEQHIEHGGCAKFHAQHDTVTTE